MVHYIGPTTSVVLSLLTVDHLLPSHGFLYASSNHSRIAIYTLRKLIWNLTTRCSAVTGVCSVGKCGRLSWAGFWVHYNIDYPTRCGSVIQVAPIIDGWTRFATTTTVHPLTCGETLSDEVILERRNGPLHADLATTTTTII